MSKLLFHTTLQKENTVSDNKTVLNFEINLEVLV